MHGRQQNVTTSHELGDMHREVADNRRLRPLPSRIALGAEAPITAITWPAQQLEATEVGNLVCPWLRSDFIRSNPPLIYLPRAARLGKNEPRMGRAGVSFRREDACWRTGSDGPHR